LEGLIIRAVSEEDAQGILEIYDPIVRHSHTSFELEVPGMEEMKQRIKTISIDRPYLVGELNGEVIGYTYAVQLRGRVAYRFTAEASIYIKSNVQNRGIGGRLYKALLSILAKTNHRTVYGVITLPNENSQKFHKQMGFKNVGVFKEAGYKFGNWYDIDWWEKKLNTSQSGINEIIPFHVFRQTKDFAKICQGI